MDGFHFLVFIMGLFLVVWVYRRIVLLGIQQQLHCLGMHGEVMLSAGLIFQERQWKHQIRRLLQHLPHRIAVRQQVVISVLRGVLRELVQVRTLVQARD